MSEVNPLLLDPPPMMTIEEAQLWLSCLGVADDRIAKIKETMLEQAKGAFWISPIGAGVTAYHGHAKDEAAGTDECEPFQYAWLRIEFSDGRVLPLEFKLPHR